MEDNKSCKVCGNCGNFKRLFTRNTRRYIKMDCGACAESGEIVKDDSGCEKYTEKPPVEFRNFMIRKRLMELLEEISAMREILKDDYD